jgi:site-specific DNA recombinase
VKPATPKTLRCAIYTRKSTEHNLDLAFNSLDAQREACEAYVKSQAHEGWRLSPERYDDGGLSGASLDRPALQLLLAEVRQGRVDVVVVYKVDRLTRSLADFAKLVETFDARPGEPPGGEHDETHHRKSRGAKACGPKFGRDEAD